MAGGKRNSQYTLLIFGAGWNTLAIVSDLEEGTLGIGSKETLDIFKYTGFLVSGYFVTKHPSYDIGRHGERYEV